MRDQRTMHPYARTLDRGAFGSLARLDGRTHHGRRARDLTAELVEYIGGTMTVTQRLLVERIVKMSLQLDLLDEKLKTGEWTAHDQRTYSGLSNAYRLALRELDNSKPSRVKAPSLDEVVTSFRRPA